MAAATIARSANRPSGSTTVPESRVSASATAASSSRARVTSRSAGRNASTITGSWRGWMAVRPRKPSRRPTAIVTTDRVIGMLQVTQSADRWLLLRDRALTRLLNLTLLAVEGGRQVAEEDDKKEEAMESF